jgi:hypothetical protein
MLRLALLLLYLFASSLIPQEKQGSGWDPLGLTSPQEGSAVPVSNPNPPSNNSDQGGGIDPLG